MLPTLPGLEKSNTSNTNFNVMNGGKFSVNPPAQKIPVADLNIADKQRLLTATILQEENKNPNTQISVADTIFNRSQITKKDPLAVIAGANQFSSIGQPIFREYLNTGSSSQVDPKLVKHAEFLANQLISGSYRPSSNYNSFQSQNGQNVFRADNGKFITGDPNSLIKYIGKNNTKATLTQPSGSEVSQASMPFSQETENKPSINPVALSVDVGQGVARIGGSAALTIANKPELAIDTTAPVWEQNIQKALFGNEPAQSFAERIAGGEQTAKQIGFGKFSLPVAFLGVLGGDALNFLGGESETEKLISKLAKETDVAKVTDLLVGRGISRDIAENYAPKIAQTTDKKAVEEGVAKAVNFQLGTHSALHQDTENQITNILMEMQSAQPGSRFSYLPQDSSGRIFQSSPSTFPKWIPSELRSSKLLDSFNEKLITGDSMTAREQRLFNVVKQEITDRTGLSNDEVTSRFLLEQVVRPMTPIQDLIKNEAGVTGRVAKNIVQTDSEARARAFAGTVEGDLKRGGYAGFGRDLKNAFEDWVNERRSARISGFFKNKEFSDLNAGGLNGIFKFQEDNQTGRFAILKKFFDEKYSLLKNTNIDVNYKKNYLPQLWKNTPEEFAAISRRLGLKPSFTLESVIENYKKGIEAGLTPKFTKLSDLASWYEQRANKAIADRRFFDFLIHNNFIQPANDAPLGWQSLNPDNFPLSRIAYNNKEYTGVLKAPPNLADAINNYLATPKGLFASFANFASTTKNIVLSSGIPKTGINTHGLNILARNTLSANNPIAGFLKGSYYLLNPNVAEKYLIENSKNALYFTQRGLTLSTEEHALDAVEGNIAQKGLGKLLAFQQKYFEKPLFNKIIPALKIERANVIFQDLLKTYPEEEASRLATQITNNIFGGINWESFGRSRETQNVLRSFALAPDWAETQINLGKETIKALFSPKNPVGKAYRVLVRNTMLAYTAANLTNHISTGHWMWQNDPGHTFEIGIGKTQDGKIRYLRPFGTALDFLRIPYDVALSFAKGDLSSVGRVIANRLSTPVRAGAGLFFNVDTFGRPITGKDQYGHPIPVKQQVGGILGLGSNLGIPQYGQALIDLATGRNNPEQTLTQGLELPFRYVKPYHKKSKASDLGGLPTGRSSSGLPGLGSRRNLPKLPGL